jgi:cyclophilin family peptidyl-prolyl cis-trans isomerase
VPRIAAVVALVALLGAGQRSARDVSAGEARAMVMAAEDGRIMGLPAIATPALDAIRARQVEDIRLLLDLTRSTEAGIRRDALVALGRYERREFTTDILQFFPVDPSRDVIHALAQSLQGPPLPHDEGGQQIDGVLELLLGTADKQVERAPEALHRALGRLPYVRNDQVAAVDRRLRRVLLAVENSPNASSVIVEVARAAELLQRRSGKLGGIGDETMVVLRRIVEGRRRTHQPEARAAAMSALLASGGVDGVTLRAAAQASAPELRRFGALALGGAGSAVPPTERTDMLVDLLGDSSAMVRYEAVRAWARQETATNGCQRLVDALSDPGMHVVLAAMDALGDQCHGDASVNDRLVAELRTPPGTEWHRGAHALVSLAKRAPERLTVPMTVFGPHPVWQVRLYAARAAAITNDLPWLERLGMDVHDNVREATLASLRRLKGDEAEPYFVSALKSDDFQLLRTAANELKGARSTPPLVDGLRDALLRLTRERDEVSRDARLALLEQLTELGDANQAGALEPLLRDFDIPVAVAAAATLQAWTGRPHEAAPEPLARPALPRDVEIAELVAGELRVRVRLGSGRAFHIVLDPLGAPLTSIRFVRLVKTGFYDGLSFHRVVPNFVIQGGSPGANEYAAKGPLMRDEITTAHHRRGTVGLSTRGRDTGDMQFFVNLVDNPRLDFEYTVFGTVLDEDLPVLDSILEGERIGDMALVKKEDKK